MRLTSFLPLTAALALTPTAFAQNDECATAMVVMNGSVVAFDTTIATPSALPWSCAGGGGPDLWYSITSVTGGAVTFELCGSSYDTAIEAHDGTCAALNLIVCNDDFCGLQSTISFPTAVGQTYHIRVGGFAGSTGSGTLTVTEAGAPPPTMPVTIVSNLPGTFIDISSTGIALGLSDDGEVDIPTTVGNTVLAPGMARVGSNGAVRFEGAGLDLAFTNETIPSTAAFDGDRTLAPFWDDINTQNGAAGEIYYLETGGVLVIQWEDAQFFAGLGDTVTFQIQVFPSGGPMIAQFLYESVDSVRADNGGSATIGFQSGDAGGYDDVEWSFNMPGSVMNGMVLSILVAPAQIGTNYCMANLNSTGMIGVMAATGSANVVANDLTLVASNLPLNAFGFFLASVTQDFRPNVSGSQGNLCLGGAIGRFVGAGQIRNTGLAGEISILIDNQMIPNSTPFFAVMAGDVVNFQSWHRDMDPVSGAPISNFTDGLEVTFN